MNRIKMTPKIEKQIIKYITKSATAKDLDELSEWIQDTNHKNVFKDYVKTHYIINYTMNNPQQNKAIERLLLKIRKEKSLVYKLKHQSKIKYAVAASIVLILSLTFFLNKETKEPQTPDSVIVNNQIKNGSDKATLTLEDGSEVALVKGKSYNVKNATSNGKEIVYKAIEEDKKEIAYNFLTVPRGGQYQITLADNTKVWLNSESQLKYPVSFISGEPRQVELVYGEGYFDVSSSTDHNGDTFQVINKNQKIEVLGTEFNIKAYKDETNIYTTLVEGKVAINYQQNKQILSPKQQSSINTIDNSITIKEVDIYNEISWRKGVFAFKEKSLKEIFKVLSRWYDVKVVFENKELELEKFNGVLTKSQKFEDILETIKTTNQINYTIDGKNIVIH